MSVSYGLSSEDWRRKMSGERGYGAADLLYLWRLHDEASRKKGGRLSASELRRLLDDLDRAIDLAEAKREFEKVETNGSRH